MLVVLCRGCRVLVPAACTRRTSGRALLARAGSGRRSRRVSGGRRLRALRLAGDRRHRRSRPRGRGRWRLRRRERRRWRIGRHGHIGGASAHRSGVRARVGFSGVRVRARRPGRIGHVHPRTLRSLRCDGFCRWVRSLGVVRDLEIRLRGRRRTIPIGGGRHPQRLRRGGARRAPEDGARGVRCGHGGRSRGG